MTGNHNSVVQPHEIRDQVTVVLGAQWGDEGKGKLVDILSHSCDIICRCQGGNNAGHTVKAEGITYFFHMIPSGVINRKSIGVLGNGVVINLDDFFIEMEDVISKGLTDLPSRLFISDRAHIVFNFHQEIDGFMESLRGGGSLGTTKKGIGPTYSSKVNRNGIRICDLMNDWNLFTEKYRNLIKYMKERYPMITLDVDEDLKKLLEHRERLKPMVKDTIFYLNSILTSQNDDNVNKKILIEGAQSTLLDIDFGTYPFVTSSNCCVGGVCTGLGIPPACVNQVYGVVKAYTTRVGEGAFPTELKEELGQTLRKAGREYGATTGRPRRCGWLDLVIVRYAHMINGFTAICITKLDVLDDFEEIKIAVNYKCKETGKIIEGFPSCIDDLCDDKIEIVYETYPGWKTSTKHCHTFQQLPINAQVYLIRIEELLGNVVPIVWVGVGANRDDMVYVGTKGCRQFGDHIKSPK